MGTMSTSVPACFVSHGAPLLAIDNSAAHGFLKGLAGLIPRPDSILVISPHWSTASPVVATCAAPETVYDFGGFPSVLREIVYRAPGDRVLAGRVRSLLDAAGYPAGEDDSRGFDHGVWVPLSLIYPQADIPVCQLSLQPNGGPGHGLAMGQALAALRDEGTLILGSGAITHNLPALFSASRRVDESAPDWVTGFADWVAEKAEGGLVEDLLDYRTLAPHAAQNHPEEDHFLPFFVALGAAGDRPRGRRVHESQAYGLIAMDVYLIE